jgi:hypothetical protein
MQADAGTLVDQLAYALEVGFEKLNSCSTAPVAAAGRGAVINSDMGRWV